MILCLVSYAPLSSPLYSSPLLSSSLSSLPFYKSGLVYKSGWALVTVCGVVCVKCCQTGGASYSRPPLFLHLSLPLIPSLMLSISLQTVVLPSCSLAFSPTLFLSSAYLSMFLCPSLSHLLSLSLHYMALVRITLCLHLAGVIKQQTKEQFSQLQ